MFAREETAVPVGRRELELRAPRPAPARTMLSSYDAQQHYPRAYALFVAK